MHDKFRQLLDIGGEYCLSASREAIPAVVAHDTDAMGMGFLIRFGAIP
jgi:hypothetical protein